MATGRSNEFEKWSLKSARVVMFDSELERYRRMSGQNEPHDTGVDYSLVVEVDTEVLYARPWNATRSWLVKEVMVAVSMG